MPRKNPVSEIQNEEEAAPSSPSLRRSSRLSSVSSLPVAATKVTTRRNSAVEPATVTTPKATRTRRASAVQDVEPKEVEIVKKAAKAAAPSTPGRRGRKPSVTAAIIEEKAVNEEEEIADEEVAAKKVTKPVVSTPSRRGRKSIAPAVEEEPKKTPLRRGRKASTVEAVEAEESVPGVVADPKKTRSVAASTKITSDVKKPTTRRKSVTIEEPEKTDEPVSKLRKTKATIEETEITPVPRTRRSIVDKRVATPVKKSPNESAHLDPKSLEPITEKVSPVKTKLNLDDEDEEDQKEKKVEEDEEKHTEEEPGVKEKDEEIIKKVEEKPITDEIIPEAASELEDKMAVNNVPESMVENSETLVEQQEPEKIEKAEEVKSEEKQETVEPAAEEILEVKEQEEETKQVSEPKNENVSEKTETEGDGVFKKPSEVIESKITLVENRQKSIDATSSFDSFHLEISESVLDSTSQENSAIEKKLSTSEGNESTPKNKTDSTTDFELLDVSVVLKSTDYKNPPQLPLPEVEKKLEITEKLNDEMAEFLEKEINQGKSEKVPQEEPKEEKETKKQEDKVEEKQSESEAFNDENSMDSLEMEPLEVTEPINDEESKENTVEEPFKENDDEDKPKIIQNKSLELDETADLIDDSQSESIKKRKSIDADLPVEETDESPSKKTKPLETESKISTVVQDVEEPMEVDSFIETEVVNKSVNEPVDLNESAKQTEKEEENTTLNESVQDKEKSLLVPQKSKISEDFLSLNKTIDHEEVIGNITLNQSTIIELPANTPAKITKSPVKKIDSSVLETSAVEQLEKSISAEKPSLHVSISKEKLQLDETLDRSMKEKIASPKKAAQEVAKFVQEVKKQEVAEEKKKVIVEFIADLPIEVIEAPTENSVFKTESKAEKQVEIKEQDESEQGNITIEETINSSLVDNDDSSDSEDDKDYINFLKQSEEPLDIADLNSTELASSDDSYQPENSVPLDDTIEDEDDDEEESFINTLLSDAASVVSETKRVPRRSSLALSTRIIENQSDKNSPSKKEKKDTPSKNPFIKKIIQEDIVNLETESSKESRKEDDSSETTNKQSSTEKPSIVLQENETKSNITEIITEKAEAEVAKGESEQENIAIEETINDSSANDSSDDEDDKVYTDFLNQPEKSADGVDLNSTELASSDDSYQPENSAILEDTIDDDEADDEEEESFLAEHEVSTLSDENVFDENKRVLRNSSTRTIETSESDTNSPNKKEKDTPSKNPLIKKIIQEELINLVTESSEDDSTESSNKQSSTEKPSVVLQEKETESETAQEINKVAASSEEKREDSENVSSDCAGKSTDSEKMEQKPETPNEEHAPSLSNKGSKRRKLYHSGDADLDKVLAPTPHKSSEPTEAEEEVEVKVTKIKKEPKVVEKENIEKVNNDSNSKSNVATGKSNNKKILKPSVEPPATDWNVLPVPAIKPSTRNTVTPKKDDGK